MTSANATYEGLEGVNVAETELSHVDGEGGVLILRGHRVERLAPSARIEDLCQLFWHGKLPAELERAALSLRLYRGRARAFALLPRLSFALEHDDAMDALRASIAQLDADGSDDLPALLTGAVAVFAAAHERIRKGLAPLAPSPAREHAADFLAMARGEPVDPALVRALDSYLVTVSDHGMNASTFAARVVASTGSDMVSAVCAALGALKGPLHGGAPGPVLDMLDAIGTRERAREWLCAELELGHRIMGMGHRVYRVRDPRAAVLEQALRKLSEHRDDARLELARTVEAEAAELLDARHPGRKLRANVEFFTALLLEAIGIDRRAFTATFAVGRVVGWCGHILEQRRRGRLIRPASRYVGPIPD